MTEITFVEAINQALRRALTDDDRVVILGQDVATNGGVIAETVGQRLDQGRPVSGTRFANGFLYRDPHRNDIIAVHLFAAEPARKRLLGDGLGSGLRFPRHGDSPLVIADDKHQGQLPDTG